MGELGRGESTLEDLVVLCLVGESGRGESIPDDLVASYPVGESGRGESTLMISWLACAGDWGRGDRRPDGDEGIGDKTCNWEAGEGGKGESDNGREELSKTLIISTSPSAQSLSAVSATTNSTSEDLGRGDTE